MVNAIQDIYTTSEIGDLSDWETFLPTYITVGSGLITKNNVISTIGYGNSNAVYDPTNTVYSFRDTSATLLETLLTWTVSPPLSGTMTLDANTGTAFDYRDITYSGTSLSLVSFVYGSVEYTGYLFLENELVYLNTIPALPDNTKVEARVYIGIVDKTQESFVDLTLSNSKIYKDRLDIVCSLLATVSGVKCDVEVGHGRVGYFTYDMCCSLQDYRYIGFDLLTSAPGYLTYFVDIESGPGAVTCNPTDFYSAVQGVLVANSCDIRTWSLEIGNFFLEPGAFCLDTSIMYVDLTDGLYNIATNNCYFKLDGLEVPVTLSGIQNGYRMFYVPQDNYNTKGTLTVTAHAENVLGDVLETNYYLLHGYNVQYNQRELWAPTENIFVRMAVNNEVFCANTEGDSFYFETVDLPSYTLESFIQPVSFVDLASTIYPQSTAFFYGGVYTVRVSKIKDFSGNVVADIIFTFEIENPIF